MLHFSLFIITDAELNLNHVLSDELKGKLNLKVDDIEVLTPEELKKEVDEAVGEVRKCLNSGRMY